MAVCPWCSAEITDDNVRFCKYCGRDFDNVNARFCKYCGKELENNDPRFCKYCGKGLNTVNEGSAYGVTTNYGKTNKTPRKYIVLPIIAIVLLAMVSGVLIVGGTVDFDHSYDEDGNLILEDRSIGLFTDIEWEISDYAGNSAVMNTAYDIVASGSKIKVITEGTYVLKITLYCKTLAGVVREITKDVSNGEVKEYDIEFEYPYGSGTMYSVSVEVSTSDFIRYKNDNIDRYPGSNADEELVMRYIDVIENNTIRNIIAQLQEFTSVSENGIDEKEEQINFIMAFVQNSIEYVSDDETMSVVEYWKYPIETLFTRTGDCEDVALLTMALFEAYFGEVVSTALVLFWGTTGENGREGHAMASIAISGLTINYTDTELGIRQNVELGYEENGKIYYVCETTSIGWEVGRISNEYNTQPSMLLIV